MSDKSRDKDELKKGMIKLWHRCPLLMGTICVFTVAGIMGAAKTALTAHVPVWRYLADHLTTPCWSDLTAEAEEVPAPQNASEAASVPGKLPAQVRDTAAETQKEKAAGNSSTAMTSENAASASDTAGAVSSTEQTVGVTKFVTYTPVKVSSRYYKDAGRTALTTEYPYSEADADYFSDAMFIGDSRTLGLHDYSGWKDKADFFCDNGFSVYKWVKDGEAVNQKTGKTVDLQTAISGKKYGKIYLMVGMNDLGYGTTDLYLSDLEKMIAMLEKTQPQAIIYLMGNLHMAASKSDMKGVYNNISLNAKNAAMASLADGTRMFYLDVNPLFTDKNGYLKDELTFDGFHLYAKGYQEWADFIRKHAIVRDAQ